MAERPKLLKELGKARMNRAVGMGLNGLAASNIGLVLLGCIAVGFFLGSWLDRRFGVTWGTPAGTLFGMAAGFREMFATLKKLNAEAKWPGAKKRDAVSSDATETSTVEIDRTAEDETVRPRIFQIPAPPVPDWEKSATKLATPPADKLAEPESVAELTARLLGENKKSDELKDS